MLSGPVNYSLLYQPLLHQPDIFHLLGRLHGIFNVLHLLLSLGLQKLLNFVPYLDEEALAETGFGFPSPGLSVVLKEAANGESAKLPDSDRPPECFIDVARPRARVKAVVTADGQTICTCYRWALTASLSVSLSTCTSHCLAVDVSYSLCSQFVEAHY